MSNLLIYFVSLCSVIFCGSSLCFEDVSTNPLLAASISTSNVVTYSIEGTKLIISGNGYMNDYAYKETPWYYSESRGKYGCDYITDIEIKEGVKSICKYAFYDFDELVNLTLPSTLESIGYEAFYDCNKIELIKIKNPVKTLTIGNEAFMWCNKLKLLFIGDFSENAGKIILDEECFENCEALEQIVMSKNVSSIKGEAFNDCYNLKTVHCYPRTSAFNWNIVENYYNSYFINAEKKSLLFSWHYYADRISYETNAFAPFKIVLDTASVPTLAHDERFHWYSSRGDIVFKECHTYENGHCKFCGERERAFSDQVIDFGVTNLSDGYYVVNKITDLGDSTIFVNGHANIIVKDNCGLYLRGGISLKDAATLNIYAEHIDYDYNGKMGYIKSENSVKDCNPGIGSEKLKTANTVNIYGGDITARGFNAAGIGTYGNSTNINIVGGIIQSHGGHFGAGIGGSYIDNEPETGLIPIFGDNTKLPTTALTTSHANIKVLNGDIIACGVLGAGIGSGGHGSSTTRIYGGYIEAYSSEGLSIGGGQSESLNSMQENFYSDVYFYGGAISANKIGGTVTHPSNVTVDADFSGTIVGELSSTNTTFKGNSSYLKGAGSFISNGSIIIILSVIAGVALITAGVFMTLYFKSRKNVVSI